MIEAGITDPVIKHVIAEYKHKAQTVTCVCGWHGSTEPIGVGPSEWQLHVSKNRKDRAATSPGS
jgi:hypothetical protein